MTDRTAVVAGVFFIAVGIAFLLDRLGVVEVTAGWLGPLLLIVLGVGVLVAGRSRSR